MAQTLVYTSAPVGIHGNANGFTSVVRTKGMSPALAEEVERLSSYRPHFGSERLSLNPVKYSHAQVQQGGKKFFVVSRTAPVAEEHTGRNNFLSCHLVLDERELPAGGPAWVLKQPNTMIEKWDGKVAAAAPQPLVPRGNSERRPCTAWESAVGDAGWAGVVAEEFLQNPDRPVFFIFDPHRPVELLDLIAEVISLLPQSKRWAVTFTTYYDQSLPQNNGSSGKRALCS